ncbi:MAG: hypothetical protein AEth_01362 [Candidatus Argoarchaeum ethanivorans]|uniref:Class III cytochrome C domain-containing protein n=1 Tax=Candidatus Argoarchaeum ethanivorans TaxID=2608793 RepID=A0A8B3S1N4_9EURY|nr:MAG: hypothetical protein AEth_01362 [Candidatus Argoarchaeum ethanivorans]
MKDTPYIITMVITGIILIASAAYIAATTNVFAPKNVTNPQIIIPEFEEIQEQTIECNICHKQPENLTRHKDGGNYCKACHGADLHDLHTSDKTVNLTCQYCHTDNAITPQRLPGHEIICDTCHNYDDPLKPSSGNIIDIHIKKGYTCDLCHIQDLQSLHERS